MPRSGINECLFNNVVDAPPPWTANLGKNPEGRDIHFLPRFRKEIDAFLSATTDSVRLVAASKVSAAILEEHDLSELEELREQIQLTELLRSIPYGRQTDHSGHTLYLYFLGLLFVYRSDEIRKALAESLGLKDDVSSEFFDRFFLQWTFASLLHDIGYIFQADSTQQRIVDRMFRASTILRRLGNDERDVRLLARKRIFEHEWKAGFASARTAEDLLDQLRLQPWGPEIGLYRDAFDTFYYVGGERGVSPLQVEEYAYLVASTGYNGVTSGSLDHAVGSGLFLLSYSTFWSWLAKELQYRGSFAVYPTSYRSRDVVNACFAVAAHNLIGKHAAGIGKLKFETNPLLYLSVMCDELQKWDRFPAGAEFLVNLTSFAEHCTDSERLLVDVSKLPLRFSYSSSGLASSVRDGLARLDSPERFVLVEHQ